jgi:hypothetical protein
MSKNPEMSMKGKNAKNQLSIEKPVFPKGFLCFSARTTFLYTKVFDIHDLFHRVFITIKIPL